jgi:transposase InsO family protein
VSVAKTPARSNRGLGRMGTYGRRVGRKQVARLMRGMGLSARRKRRLRLSTNSAHVSPKAPNLTGRDITASAPDQV